MTVEKQLKLATLLAEALKEDQMHQDNCTSSIESRHRHLLITIRTIQDILLDE